MVQSKGIYFCRYNLKKNSMHDSEDYLRETNKGKEMTQIWVIYQHLCKFFFL